MIDMLKTKLLLALKFILFSFFFLSYAYGQNTNDYPCFAVAKNNGAANMLYGFSPEISLLEPIGPTGTNQIVAITINSNQRTIYAFESGGGANGVNGALGTIDPVNGNFQTIGSVGTGMGEFGAVALNNVKGMAYDNVNNILYAVHRVEGDGNNDVLFKIDAATGMLIPNSMEDDNGNVTDYASIEENSFQNTFTHDVVDIAISTNGNELYVLYNYIEGDLNPVKGQNLSIINSVNGNISSNLVLLINYEMEGLGIASTGELYGLTNSNSAADPVKIIYIEPTSGQYQDVGALVVSDFNFESLDCFHTVACAQQLTIGPSISTGLYKAKTIIAPEIATDNIVAVNSDVQLEAEEFVSLESIEVPLNSDFTIDIKDCN